MGGDAPVHFRWRAIGLNVNVSHGTVRVAILDEDENPIPGYTIGEFDTIDGVDALRVQASWGGNTDLNPLSGQPVRLRFELDNAKIYAMQFVP